MYNVIEEIISHTWVTNTTSDQQYIYYICGTVIAVLTVAFIDGIKDVFRHFTKP